MVIFLLSALHFGAYASDEVSVQNDRTEWTGVARDSKIGAVVVVEGEAPLHLAGERWPPGVTGLPVVVRGRLSVERYAPIATRGPDGEVAQGVAPGSSLDRVIREPRWHLVGAGTGIEPGPWRVVFTDRSGHETVVERAPGAQEILWAYDGPVPARGELESAKGAELWLQIRRLAESTTGDQPSASVETAGRGIRVLVAEDAALAVWVEALRSAAPKKQ